MIVDGYTQSRQIGPLVVAFRPLLRSERVAWKPILEACPALLMPVLQKQVVASIGGRLEELDAELFVEAGKAILGIGEDEAAEERSLKHSAGILVSWPHLARPGICQRCQAVWFDPLTGSVARDEHGHELARSGPVLCETRAGCPLGHKDHPCEIPQKHRLAYRHYRECRLLGFPDDAIVRRNAAIFRQAESSGRRNLQASRRNGPVPDTDRHAGGAG